jgi:hypothetical protein
MSRKELQSNETYVSLCTNASDIVPNNRLQPAGGVSWHIALDGRLP